MAGTSIRPSKGNTRILSILILIKIVITCILWVIPLLFLRLSFLKDICGCGNVDSAAVFIRLLGLAYASLLVGYGFGFVSARAGIYPTQVVWAGILSNGGACLVLVLHWHDWSKWSAWGPKLMSFSLVATELIGLGLVILGPARR